MSIVMGLVIGFIVAYMVGALYSLHIIKKELVCYDESLKDLDEAEGYLKRSLGLLDTTQAHLDEAEEYFNKVKSTKQE